MNFWWVNQNQTYQQEVDGGYMWSPQRNANGAYNQFYENMRHVQPGDLVFSFRRTVIPTIGRILSTGREAPKPDEFGNTGANWDNQGWRVDVEYTPLTNVIKPKDYMSELAPTLPKKYSPIRATGEGLQSVYLAAVPTDMANVLIAKIGPEAVRQAQQRLTDEILAEESDRVADQIEREFKERPDVPETEKLTLSKSRRGQGLFRERALNVEPKCRITGIDNPKLLVASHIKPWARCNTHAERLDGNNGLMLTPTIDRLFDRGFIGFTIDGKLLVSNKLTENERLRLGLRTDTNVGSFTNAQEVYLQYHRLKIFKG